MTDEYPDKKILEKLNECQDEFNKCTPKAFKKLENIPENPIQTVFRRFGDWKTAKKEAGLFESDSESPDSEGTRGQTYSNEQLLGHLRIVADEMDKVTPTTMKQVKEDPDKPGVASPSVVIERFGSWKDAKRKAELETVDERGDNGRQREYTNKDYLDLLRECEEKYGKVTQENFEKMRKEESDRELPSPSAIMKRFENSWTYAKTMAGVEDDDSYGQQYSDEDLTEMLQECDEEFENCSASVFDENFPASADLVAKRFGSWNEGKQEAGIKTIENNEEELDEETILKQIQKCREKHGKCIASVFNDDDEFCSSATAARRFGSWSEAKEKAKEEADKLEVTA